MAVVLVMSPSVCRPGWPIGNAWVVVHFVADLRPRGVSSLSLLRVHGVPMQVCVVLRCATHAGLRSGAFSMFKSLGKKSVRCGAFSMFKHLWVRAQVWVAFQAIPVLSRRKPIG